MKSFKCRDAGVDCDWQIRDQNEDEIIRRASEHAKKDHGINEISDELKQKIRSAIRIERAA